MYDGGSGWWSVMLLGMILFWIAVLVGLYLLYRVVAQRGTLMPVAGPSPTETPRAILDRRLAAGEISPDDYDALRRKLEGSG
jgi:uncharacterized membrane protein